MSRKPSVINSAVRAPVRSRMVLMATVEPCRNSPAERKSLLAFSTPLSMPSTNRCGVDNVLPNESAPVCSSNTATSVKVPPMSAARRMWGRDLGCDIICCFVSCSRCGPMKEPQLPGRSEFGPPVSWVHGVWVSGPDDEPVEWYDELDAQRWSIRCVRKFRDGSLQAYSIGSPNWQYEMPDQPFPSVKEINEDPDFVAREISKQEFEVAWEDAAREMKD